MPHRTPTTARRTMLAAAFATLLLLGPGTAPKAQETHGPIGRTTILFNDDILEDLDIELIGVNTTAAPYRDGSLGFAIEANGWLEYTGTQINTAGFSAGSLLHSGGFTLAFDDLELSINGFELRVAEEPYAFDLFDTHGNRWFRLANMQFELSPDARELRMINSDLLLSPEFAALLGRDDLANSYLAVIDMVVSADLPRNRGVAGTALAAGGVECPVPNVGQPVDIQLTGLDSVTQLAREAGGRVAISGAADLGNAGTNSVEWFQTIVPDDVASDIGPHPYLSLHFYRLAGGRLSELGQSDVKHAFLSVNTGCNCPAGHTIYPGCGDRYGTFLNGDRVHLAPREGVDAFAGSWTRLGSHFDSYSQAMGAIDPTLTDNFRSHGGNTEHTDSFEHRLTVQEPDLMVENAQYFFGAWYVVGNDSNIMNSMGHRQVGPNLVGSTWSFPTITSLTEGSILDEFVNPSSTPVGQDTELVDTGEGRLQVAVRTTSLPNGNFHYEYVVMNFDFDRRISSFSVPLASGVTVSNPEFVDVDPNSSNDWSVNANQGVAITWTAPAGNELDWGTLYNFAFDSNVPAATLSVTLTPATGAGLSAVSSLAPDPSGVPPAEGGNDDCLDAFPITLATTAGSLELATPDGISSQDDGSESDVWYSFTPTRTGNLRINTCGSMDLAGIDTILSVHMECPGDLSNELAANDDYQSSFNPFECDFVPEGPGSLDSAVNIAVTQNVPVLIRVTEFLSAPVTRFILNVEEPPSNDLPSGAPLLSAAGQSSVAGTLSGAGNEGGEPEVLGLSFQPDVWYLYTPTQTGTLLIDTCGTFAAGGPDTVLSVHPFSSPLVFGSDFAASDDYEFEGGNPTACDGPGGSIFDSAIAVELTTTASIYIRVSRYDDTSDGPFTLNINPNPPFAVTLSASLNPIGPGGTTTLGWLATQASTCIASGGWSGVRLTGGEFDVTQSTTTSYTLTCTRIGSTNMTADTTVVTIVSLANDSCSTPTLISGISLPTTIVLDTTIATADPSDPDTSPACAEADDPDGATAWYTFTATETGVVRLSTVDSDYDTVLSVWSTAEACGSLDTRIACNDNVSVGSLQSQLSFSTQQGTSYRIQVGSWSGFPGGRLIFAVPEPSGSAAFAVVLGTLAALRRRARRRR